MDGFVVPLCATIYETPYWVMIRIRVFDNEVNVHIIVQPSVVGDSIQLYNAVSAGYAARLLRGVRWGVAALKTVLSDQ